MDVPTDGAGGPQARIPVTMLSGFLGAGKTTLLKHILETSSCKIACLVNDLASINVDAKTVRNSTSRDGTRGESAISDMVELQNGCACCSAADELFPAFAELVMMGDRQGKPYDRFILENSGVAEPQNIRDSFNEAIEMGHPITQRIELDGFITIVDASSFISDFSSKAPMAMRPDLGDGAANFRPVVDLLVEQIECSDVIVLNKADALDAARMESLKPVIASMNPLAHIVTATYGKIPMELVHRSGIASKMNIEAIHRSSVMAVKESSAAAPAATTAAEHDHHHDHNHHHDEHCHHHHDDHHHHHHDDHGHHHHEHGGAPIPRKRPVDPAKKFGITSFVYQRRKPFHPLRLRQLVLRWLPATNNSALEGESPATGDSPIKRVLRSKGFAWLANNHLSAFYWSHAGQHFELREEGDWWVTIDPQNFPPDARQRKIIYEDFQPDSQFGDRRQEIVFIGSHMNEEKIVEQLDQALLTDEELYQYVENWSSSPDPGHPDLLYFRESGGGGGGGGGVH